MAFGDPDSRLGLLRLERVDIAPHQHGRQDEVLQDLNPLRRTRLVVLLEGFVKVLIRLLPVP